MKPCHGRNWRLIRHVWEFQLDAYFACSDPEETRANTGWGLHLFPTGRQAPEPTTAELAALRRVDVTGDLWARIGADPGGTVNKINS